MDGVGLDILKKRKLQGTLDEYRCASHTEQCAPTAFKCLSTQSKSPDDTTGGFTRHKNLLI